MDYRYIESLVIKAKDGDEISKEKLAKEFTPFILNLSKKTFIHGYDFDDLKNECYKALFKSVQAYNTKNHRFVAYATIAIKNELHDILRTSLNKKSVNGMSTLVLDDNLENIIESDSVSPDFLLCLKDEHKSLKMAINKLSPDEKELINNIFFNKITLSNYAKSKNMRYSTAIRRKKSILKKMLKLYN